MKKVSLCLLLNKSHYQLLYCFERLGFKVVEKQKEIINKDEPKEYINTIYGIEVELIVGYTKQNETKTIDYFKEIANKFIDVSGLNKYQAYNKIFKEAEYDLVCVYDANTIMQKNWLLELVFYAQAVDKCGIVSICENINDICCYSLLGQEQEDFHNVFIPKTDILTNESTYLFDRQNLYMIGGFDTKTELFGNEYKQLQLRYSYTLHNNFYIPTQSSILLQTGYTITENNIELGEKNLQESIKFMKKTGSFYLPI